MLKKMRQINAKVILHALMIIWRKDKWRVVVTFIMLVIENAILFYMAKYLKKTMDTLSMNINHLESHKDEISNYILVAAIMALFFIISRPILNYYSEIQSQKIIRYVDRKIYQTCLKLNLAFFESPAYFDVLQRARAAGPGRINGIFNSVVTIIKLSGNLLILFWYIFKMNPWVIPILILLTIPLFVTKFSFSKKMAALNHQNAAKQREASYIGNILTDIHHAKEIRAYNFGGYLFERYCQVRDSLLVMSNKLMKQNKIREILSSAFLSLVWSVLFYFMIRNIIQGNNHVTDITFFLALMPMAMNAIHPFSNAVTNLYQNSLYVQHLFDLFTYAPSDKEIHETQAIPAEIETIEFNRVCFNYPESTTILENVSLRLQKGKIIALVGLNGAGKSTTLKLFSRLYDPVQGSILANGIDIKQFDIQEYRKRISVVFQDFAKYQFTVNENVFLGDVSNPLNDIKIKSSLNLMHANQFVEKLPSGYETKMGRLFEGGKDFSLGEWQKIAIARALYRDSDFVFLDEPTSALDAISEKDFFVQLKESIGKRGALLISHKISAVKHADYIYILNAGKITEEGTHEQLMNMKGLYHELFDSSENIWENKNNA